MAGRNGPKRKLTGTELKLKNTALLLGNRSYKQYKTKLGKTNYNVHKETQGESHTAMRDDATQNRGGL